MAATGVVIVLARCGADARTFGIRFEEKRLGVWWATWAFPLAERRAAREGYASTRIEGDFEFEDGFPGCPSCAARSLVRCGCGKIGCWDGKSTRYTCPWCRHRGRLVAADWGPIGASGDG